ncbi:MAG: hypothetical protein WCD18_04755 [Thermosynechococcaceae cyanobacterium]
MRKFKYFWITLVALVPLTASRVNAQLFGAPIDILGPVQEDIIRELRQNPRRRQQSQPTIPQPSSSPASNSCHQIIAKLGELNRQGVTEVTINLREGGTITDSPDDLIDDVPMLCPHIHSLSFRENPGFNTNRAPRSTSSLNTLLLHVVGVYEGFAPPGVDDRPWWAKCEGDIENQAIIMECHKKYAGITTQKEVVINVADTSRPIVLALMAYDQTLWKINIGKGVKINKIILAGYYSQAITGLPSTVPIETYTHTPSVCSNCKKGTLNYFYSYEGVPPQLKSITGLDATSFQGQYKGKIFFIR